MKIHTVFKNSVHRFSCAPKLLNCLLVDVFVTAAPVAVLYGGPLLAWYWP